MNFEEEEFIAAVGLMSLEELKVIQKAINKRKKDFRVIRKNGAYTPWDLEVSRRMEGLIRKNFPKLKPKTESQLQKWAVDVRKLRVNDGYDKDTIIQVLKFALTDEFWRKNILSGAKLRNKFDVLLVASDKKPKLSEAALVDRQKKAEIPQNATVDPDSPGYKRAQEIRNKLAERKAV